jgi:hypothetical protein
MYSQADGMYFDLSMLNSVIERPLSNAIADAQAAKILAERS